MFSMSIERRLAGCLLIAATLLATASRSDSADDQIGSSATPPEVSTAGLDVYRQSGTNEITGRAEYDTKLFGHKIFAHQRVGLYPLIAYNWWFFHRLGFLLGAKHFDAVQYPHELTHYNRDTYTDSDGFYKFTNLPAAAYLVDFNVDYESDSSRIENNTVYSNDDEGFPTSSTSQRVKLKLRRELDEVVATVRIEGPSEHYAVTGYSVLGTQTCCDGEL